MVETEVKTKKIEYDENLLTVVLVKRTPLVDRKMVGKTLLEWMKSAVSAFEVKVVESDQDAFSIAKDTITESRYILVMDAQYPLLKKQDIIEMLDYMIYKSLEVGHFLFGSMYAKNALNVMEDRSPMFVVPIAEKHATKVEDEYSLMTMTRLLKERILVYHMKQGVRIIDPDHTIIDCNVVIGKNVTIAPFVMLLNGTVIGDDCYIGAYSLVNRSTLMPNVEVYASRLENVLVKEHKVVSAYQDLHDCEI